MDLPILKHLDVLIGLAVVMLIMATVVVAITQFILSCRSARSLSLRERLTELVSQIAPKLESSEAEYVAERILRHPLIGRQRWLRAPWPAAPVSPEPEQTVVEADWPLWWRRRRELKLPLPAVARGEVVLRHEIVVALLEWAAGEGPLTMQDRTLTAEKPEARERMEQLVGKLREALLAAGVADAAQAARDVRTNLVEFESANQEQASQVWHTQALVRSGLGDLTGRVFAWYDASMDRVTEYFSLEAKVVSSVVGLVLCFMVQLDSLDLLRRLSQDDKFRTAVVAQAETAQRAYEELAGSKGDEDKKKQAMGVVQKSVETLRDAKVVAVQESMPWNDPKFPGRIPGVVLSWILVSLGAPFWYDLLKKLLGFRSILQSKDDAEREKRREEQTVAAKINEPASMTAAASTLQGPATGVVLDRAAPLRALPSARAAVLRELPAGYLLNVEGSVQAEAVNAGDGVNTKWYRTVQGDYLLSGDAIPAMEGQANG
jgi:hypothetical protein